MVHAVSDKRIAADAAAVCSSLKLFWIRILYYILCPVARRTLLYYIMGNRRRVTAAIYTVASGYFLTDIYLFFFTVRTVLRDYCLQRFPYNKLKFCCHPSRTARSALTAVQCNVRI